MDSILLAQWWALVNTAITFRVSQVLYGLDSSGSVVGSCEYCNNISGFTGSLVAESLIVSY
jgi:hypothetical protein